VLVIASISPPLVGGDEGEGDTNRSIQILHDFL